MFGGIQESDASKRVYAHLLIGDSLSATAEARRSLLLFPESKSLQIALIRSLSEQGYETEAIEQWNKTICSFAEEKQSRHLLETLAWGVLTSGDHSAQMHVRLVSLLGSSLTKDARAIPILLQALKGSNAMLRSIAASLCASYGDAPLQSELIRLLREEKVWHVRLAVIKALGQMRVLAVYADLKEIVGNPKTVAEEKAAAIVALVNMYESIDKQELNLLAHSQRAGLRELACEVIGHFELKNELSLLIPLLQDTSSHVRLSALNAVGLMRVSVYKERTILDLITPNLNDVCPEVAITASWVAHLLDHKVGGSHLEKWMRHENPIFRRVAAAALAATGKYGISLAKKMLKETSDPYVKVNLALGLIGQREEVRLCCDTIYSLFWQETQTLWMWDKGINPLFRSLAPSTLKHIDQIPNYPVVADQLVRLDLLNVLSVMRYPKAQEAVKGFLQHHSWGITGTASATLLKEGDAESLRVVKGLLKDPDEKIRIQAALILALGGGDPAAVSVLQDAYHHVDREMKVYILEALSHIGDPQSIPFLLEILKEPFQVLRVVAASALIQCLYH